MKNVKVLPENWNNWIWQMDNLLVSEEQIQQYLSLNEDELKLIRRSGSFYEVTPFFASLLGKSKSYNLISQVLPVRNKYKRFENDYLEEENSTTCPNIIHKYTKKVAFLASDKCSSFCQFCTRRRIYNRQNYKIDYNQCIEYIRSHNEINDVLITGGDPFTLSDDILEFILAEIRKIEHIEIVRIGTRTPVMMPMRVTESLTRILKKYKPLYINIHVNHPDELTPEMKHSCGLLIENGAVLGSQTVLLKDINDDPYILETLFNNLLKIGVKPYYLYQCDKVYGCEEYITSPIKGIDIINYLQGKISGMAVPKFIIDMPGKSGKISLAPNGYINHTQNNLILRDNFGNIINYKINE